MKRLFFGLGIMVAGLTCSVASASDYYYQGDCCPDQCDPCCDSDFDGFYFGANLGVLTNHAYRGDLDGFTNGGCCTLVDTEFTIGLQLGYDWNCGCSLFGLVADWNWVSNDNSHHSDGGQSHRHGNDWFVTIRGRAGVTVCDCLFYLTGGFAVIDADHRWGDGSTNHSHSNTKWGWTGGTGVEYLLGCNWSLGAEILFMHFDDDSSSHNNGTANFRFKDADSAWVGRLVLNYRFGDLFDCCR